MASRALRWLLAGFMLVEAAAGTVAAFGNGIEVKGSPNATRASFVPLDTYVSWACEVPTTSALALCEDGAALKLWSPQSGSFVTVELAPLTSPVGAIFSRVDQRVWVACFGDWPTPGVTSGLAVVNPASGTLEATHAFPNGQMHVHNVYEMTVNNTFEIRAAVLGNPWLSPPLPGLGLVQFDRSRGFLPSTGQAGLSSRSAKQQSDGVVYTLTQEASGQPTRLARLEQSDGHLLLVSQTVLPPRDGGSGGADVVLSQQPDKLFATDRTSGNGRLHVYTYSVATRNFSLEATLPTGKLPRYTGITAEGDVVSCNHDDSSLTVFAGLGLTTTTPVAARVLPTVQSVSFFIESALLPSTLPRPEPLPATALASA